MRKKSEFRQHHYWNCKKKYEREREKKKWCDGGGRKNWISIMRLSKFLLPQARPWSAPGAMLGGGFEREYELWQPSCRNYREGGERKYELWQPSCWKWEEKKILATKLPKSWGEIFFKKKVAMDLLKWKGKTNLWQWSCRKLERERERERIVWIKKLF